MTHAALEGCKNTEMETAWNAKGLESRGGKPPEKRLSGFHFAGTNMATSTCCPLSTGAATRGRWVVEIRATCSKRAIVVVPRPIAQQYFSKEDFTDTKTKGQIVSLPLTWKTKRHQCVVYLFLSLVTDLSSNRELPQHQGPGKVREAQLEQ